MKLISENPQILMLQDGHMLIAKLIHGNLVLCGEKIGQYYENLCTLTRPTTHRSRELEIFNSFVNQNFQPIDTKTHKGQSKVIHIYNVSSMKEYIHLIDNNSSIQFPLVHTDICKLGANQLNDLIYQHLSKNCKLSINAPYDFDFDLPNFNSKRSDTNPPMLNLLLNNLMFDNSEVIDKVMKYEDSGFSVSVTYNYLTNKPLQQVLEFCNLFMNENPIANFHLKINAQKLKSHIRINEGMKVYKDILNLLPNYSIDISRFGPTKYFLDSLFGDKLSMMHASSEIVKGRVCTYLLSPFSKIKVPHNPNVKRFLETLAVNIDSIYADDITNFILREYTPTIYLSQNKLVEKYSIPNLNRCFIDYFNYVVNDIYSSFKLKKPSHPFLANTDNKKLNSSTYNNFKMVFEENQTK